MQWELTGVSGKNGAMNAVIAIRMRVLLAVTLAVFGSDRAWAQDKAISKQAVKEVEAQGKPGEFLLKDVALNDLFEWFAKRAGREYQRVDKLDKPAYKVTGHLNPGDPVQQMMDVAFMHGL